MTEVCDDRSCSSRSAGGVALPQPGQHLHDTCPAKWYFRYLIGLSEPTTGALALGKAFHGTLARNSRQKLSTGRDIEAEELREVFDEEWSLRSQTPALREMTMRMSLPLRVKYLSQLTWQKCCSSRIHDAVKQTVQGEIAGVTVRGIVDLLEVGGYWRECERSATVE